MIYGLPDDHLVRYPKTIQAIDLKTANETAKKYFKPNHVAIIVVGDLAKIEEPVRKLNLGPVVHLDPEGKETTGSAQFSVTR